MSAPISSHLTRCGLPGIELIPYGTHACHFYASREDLVAALVPYCIAGLDANERCFWITAEPLSARAAIQALREQWLGADEAMCASALRILDFDRWYTGSQGLRGAELVDLWLEEERRALAEGYAGLRITGNTSFLAPDDLASFIEYEKAVTERFAGRRIVALCSYIADHSPSQVDEVVHAHHCRFEHPDESWRVVTELAARV